jgi:hypothetical protein
MGGITFVMLWEKTGVGPARRRINADHAKIRLKFIEIILFGSAFLIQSRHPARSPKEAQLIAERRGKSMNIEPKKQACWWHY